MPIYSFTAIKQDNTTLKSTIEASDRMAAMSSIGQQGLRIIELKEQVDDRQKALKKKSNKRVKSDELVMFTRQLSAMVGAGVPILRSLNSLAQYANSPTFKVVITDVSKRIESGESLTEALSAYPSVFNDVYVNMVRAGEAAGILDDILRRLASQQEKNATIRKKVKSAMTYPMVLVSITIASFFGLMLFVIPSIGDTIKNLAGEDAELPGLTQAMMGISSFFVNQWYIVFPLLAAAIWGTLRYIKTPIGKRKFHTLMVRAPIISKIIKKIAVARFTRTYSALVGAGVSVLEALNITAKGIGNIIYEEAIMSAAARVETGETLSSIISENIDLFPPIVGQMLAVGEETGQTDKVLIKVADYYEEEVDVAIASLSSTIEPVMIVLMGAMVGLIAASVMLPITGLANQIKG